MADRKKVIDIALAEVGYLEKRSNENLDSKTGNAGSANFTKYARDLDRIEGFYNGPKNGYPWCDVFVDWCFVQAYGPQKAKRLLCQPNCSAGAGCTYSAAYYKAHGQLHSNPQPGDQIFFGTESMSSHTGLVVAVENGFVYTVEGNTSSAAGVIPNGGAVCKKSYPIGSGRIYAYGRPDYGSTEMAEPDPDEEYRPMYFYRIRLPLLKPGMTDKAVHLAQILLTSAGHLCASPDNKYTKDMVVCVENFQREHGLLVDGEIGVNTWRALMHIN